jgi:hypothetical protein
MSRRSLTVLGLALIVVAVAPVAAKAETLAAYDGYQVSAYDGRQVWSHKIDEQHFELMLRENGAVRKLAVRPQPLPYDVTLGTDARGKRVAVYASCTRGDGTDYPLGCRLRAIELASGRDRALRGTHAPGASEYMPALSHGVVVFARHGRRKDDQGHGLETVRIKRLGARRPSRSLYRRFALNVLSTAVSRRAAAFAVEDFTSGRGENKLFHVRRRGGRARLVARSRRSTDMEQISPTFRGRNLYWGASELAASPASGSVVRCAHHRVRAAAVGGEVESVAADSVHPGAPLVVALRGEHEGHDRVVTVEPAKWSGLPDDVTAHCPR